MTEHKIEIPSLKEHVSKEEWELRVNLAAAYRLVAAYGWDDLVFTHISARIPGPEHHFLINPYGMMFEEITASSLVKVDLNGEKVGDSPFPVNPAGFNIHSAVHEVRPDVECVLHTHTSEGVAVSAKKEGLLPISQQSLFALSSLSYHNYEGVALNVDEKKRIQDDLGDTAFMILRNHGLLVAGPTIADAFLFMFTLQRACEIQVMAQTGNSETINIPQPILDGIKAQATQVTKGMGGALAWPGLLRKLERMDPSFKD